MKTQQTNISEVRLIYRTKVKTSDRQQVKCSKDAYDIFMESWDIESIKANAGGIIICHNHPGGNVQPSESDIAITRKRKESCNLMDLQLLDHLIMVPEGVYYSMADEGIM